MREGEILNLTWDRVSLDKCVISLEAEDTKDREKRDIPMSDEVFSILSRKNGRIRTVGNDSHVFMFRKRRIHSIRKALQNACDKAEIPYGRFVKNGFVFHDLRHTFNTNMRKAGIHESVIMKITGHSTREMFDRYNTVDHENKRNAINQLQAFFANSDQNSDQGSKNESGNKKGSLQLPFITCILWGE